MGSLMLVWFEGDIPGGHRRTTPLLRSSSTAAPDLRQLRRGSASSVVRQCGREAAGRAMLRTCQLVGPLLGGGSVRPTVPYRSDPPVNATGAHPLTWQ